jgi:NADH dehydrogenase [ubiquinone] 1 alpha subcomplex assembly factor 5
MSEVPQIFDRSRVRAHRARAARASDAPDFLLREMAERLADRLLDMMHTFPFALDLGAHHGILAEYVKGRAGIEHMVQAELSQALLSKASGMRVVADEEYLPFADNSFDAVLSVGSLHWANDLPGALVQAQRALKPDGLFLAMLPGGQTLKELRHCLEKAEIEISGGVSPRISPFVDVRDAGSLLQRAGFALPVVDSELLNVSYAHPLKLMHDLRNMGEANALTHCRKGFTPCAVMMLAADMYLREYSDGEGRIPATFELVTMTAWKPHPSQQQPAKRGSGKVNLRDVLGGGA